MTFTIKIALQPFEVSFETGSIVEAVAILSDPKNELGKLAALATGEGGGDDANDSTAITSGTVSTETPKTRGRKPRNQPDPATAVAPAPLPVGDAPPPPAPAPVNTAPNADGIPAFLDRREASTSTAVAPPPPVVAQPAPPPPPPIGTLAPKVVAELNRRKEGSADQGAALVAWLAGAGLVVPNATYQEAIDCISFLDDAKLGPVAGGLGVA